MRKHIAYLVLVGLVALAAGASSTFAAHRSGEINFVFNGRLIADAGNSSSLYVDVFGGTKPALKKLVGQPSEQHFAVGSGTQFLRWAHGVPLEEADDAVTR